MYVIFLGINCESYLKLKIILVHELAEEITNLSYKYEVGVGTMKKKHCN